MQTPTNIFETYQLIDASRTEAKEAALKAIREHIARMQEPGCLSQPEHPRHVGYIDALEFACTLIKFCI
jgi:hypothetical protein